MTYPRFRALPLVLAALVLPACVIDLDQLDQLGHHGGCRGGDARSERYTIDEPITTVIVDGGVADLSVRAHDQADQEGVVIDATLLGGRDQPEPRIHVDGGVLYVSTTCDVGCCAAELSLAIPAAATLEVELGVGDVTVAGLAGTVEIDVGTGDIALERLAGALGLHTGTGEIQGHGLLGTDAWVDVGTGEVSLAYDSAAPLQAVSVEVGVGDVDLRVPEGGYDLRLSAGVGDVSVADLQDQGETGRGIDVDVGTGDIDVRGL
jgi:hypothetical protein